MSVGCGFVQLKYLEASNCERLEEIFSDKSEREVNEHKKIKFPSLVKLVLRRLPKFISFYKGIKEIEFPKLDTLEVSELPNIQSLFSDVALYALFPSMVNIHCLLILHIREMKTLTEIWDSKHQAGSYIKLKELHVYDCPKLENIVTFTVDQRDREHIEEADEMIIMLPELTSLLLENLPELKSFYQKKPYSSSTQMLIQHHLFNKEVGFPNLSRLELVQLESIEQIWCDQLSRGAFPKITYIRVADCNKLQNLGPSSMATSTLQVVVVRECSKMEELFKNEENAEQDKTLFPQLRSLILVNMLELKRFCHMSHDWELPSLCEVYISMCPNMKTFSPTFVHTPNLTNISVEAEYGVWENNINDTLQFISKKGLFSFMSVIRSGLARRLSKEEMVPGILAEEHRLVISYYGKGSVFLQGLARPLSMEETVPGIFAEQNRVAISCYKKGSVF